MLHNRKPDEWEVFNYPSRHPVKYYSILKKKREFSQLIRQYDAQVFKHGYFHYCSIVPKNISSTINNKYELFIIFLGEVPDTSFIGFRIKVSKETFIDESNSLLLFLKKSKKPVFYLMNNNCIHVQCGENAWELFYLLYAAYLRQFVVTVIGTQFFYNFVYSFCIQREIQLLELLFKGSKIIRISKKSIYYKIHRKRKISLSNLIHMTLNMPQSKRCIISFNSKVSLLHPSIDSENFYTCSGSKIHVSKLVLTKFKNPITESVHDNAATSTVAAANGSALFYPLEVLDSKREFVENTPDFKNKHTVNSSTSKRKLEEIENDSNDIHLGPTTSKFLKVSESLCRTGVKNQWELFTSIKPYSVTSYSGIPCLKHFVPNLMNNGKSNINNSDSYLCNAHNHDSVKNNVVPSILSEKNDVNNEYLTVKKLSADHVNICSTTKTDCNFESSLSLKGNTSDKLIHVHVSAECTTQKSVNSNHKIPEYEKQESLHSYNVKGSSSDIKNSPSLPANFDEYNINTSDDVSFITAAGKNINFSDTAFLAARRLLEDVCDDENEQDLPLKSNFGSKKKRLKRQSIDSNNELCRKYGTGNVHSVKTPDVRSCNVINLKDNEMASKNLQTGISENTHENFQSDTAGNDDSNVFSTAAGKSIKLSNAALQAAQKLMQDALQDESEITPTADSYSKHKKTTCKNSSAFRDIGFSLKKSVAEEIDVDMDKTLVEKFFEDTCFDEKELTTLESNKDSNVNLIVEPKSDKNIPVRKPRKSLGGRRNMRFCSDAL